MNNPPQAKSSLGLRRNVRAFTLLELLVVIAIIGLIAKVALPALKGMNKSNSMISAQRQLLDDLAFARRSAIANRTDVYVVFIPPWIASDSFFSDASVTDPRILTLYTNLYQGQYNKYAILTLRSVGDQPGQSTPRYLTDWRTLPKGVFFDPNKFNNPYTNNATYVGSEYGRAFACDYNTTPFPPQNNFVFPTFPFPSVYTNAQVSVSHLPYLAFNYLGQLKTPYPGMNEAIPLVRGSVLYPSALNGGTDWTNANFLIMTNGEVRTNMIHVDWLTGRATVDKNFNMEIQP